MNSDLVISAADMIRDYDPKLADLWLKLPFNRLSIARAFKAGLKPKEGCHDYQIGDTLMTVAEMDIEDRKYMSEMA